MSGAVLDRVSRRGLAIAIVGALTGVLLTATPAAAATCGTFSGGTLTIAPSGSNETVTVARTAGGTITVNGAACTATVTSTNTIVFPNPGVNRSETFVIDTTNGPFAPGADEVGDPTAEIEWSLDFGGGNGDALQVLGGSGADVITLGTGGFNLSGDADADGAVPANNENYQLSGAGGSDTISAAGSAATGSGFNGAVTMNGGADNDTITGGPANDTINGDDGADVLDGGVGNAGNAYDALRGGTAAGSDTSTSDTVTYASVSEAVTVDLAFAGFQLTGGAYYDDIAAIENVVGTSATDTLTGNAGNNSITGAGANDTISGAAGNDTFPQGIAAEGADAISGGDGT
ncbi:MAG: calcium-binding protein, partial [Actinomycetota bacterium]